MHSINFSDLLAISILIFLSHCDTVRRCPAHVPFPADLSADIETCQREIAVGGNLNDPNIAKSIRDIVVEHGYSWQSYNITTQDSYILTIFRVPGGRASPPRKGKPAVLLQHGMATSSECWIAVSANDNLVYRLVHDGYDVWLGNSRGSDFSLEHVKLDPKQHLSYWNFSFHEMGIYDLPRTIDLILAETGHDKISYIGHSQGAASFLVGLSELPELNPKFHAAYLMAPAVYLGGTRIRLFDAILPLMDTSFPDIAFRLLQGRMERKDFPVLGTLLGISHGEMCTPKATRCGICARIASTFYDLNPHQMNYTNMPYMLSKLFNTENFKSTLHFVQNGLSCQFRKYDYRSSGNVALYGSPEPPEYDIQNVRVPMHIFWAEQDPYATPSDIARLVNKLNSSSVKGVYRVNDDTFTHTDFVIGKDAGKLLYDGLIELMNSLV